MPIDIWEITSADRLVSALRTLYESAQFAIDTECSFWVFAVPIDELGLGENELRWLILRNIICHRTEKTPISSIEREFDNAANSAFDSQSCFVLNRQAIAEVESILFQSNHKTESILDQPPRRVAAKKPNWDASQRVLQFNQRVIKQFRWPAMNQEMVLCAFEEESWPARIDDPLPRHGETDPKRRLNDTIKCLNRNQIHRLVQFRGDGTGEGVCWEPKNS